MRAGYAGVPWLDPPTVRVDCIRVGWWQAMGSTVAEGAKGLESGLLCNGPPQVILKILVIFCEHSDRRCYRAMSSYESSITPARVTFLLVIATCWSSRHFVHSFSISNNWPADRCAGDTPFWTLCISSEDDQPNMIRGHCTGRPRVSLTPRVWSGSLAT